MPSSAASRSSRSRRRRLSSRSWMSDGSTETDSAIKMTSWIAGRMSSVPMPWSMMSTSISMIVVAMSTCEMSAAWRRRLRSSEMPKTTSAMASATEMMTPMVKMMTVSVGSMFTLRSDGSVMSAQPHRNMKIASTGAATMPLPRHSRPYTLSTSGIFLACSGVGVCGSRSLPGRSRSGYGRLGAVLMATPLRRQCEHLAP